ncbi:hypothetical protein QT327_28030, partial [Olivibacter sp. 47]|uniref:hypothetical protein n=1 Tax=Olivibacter sp. 47 TaxID=3056486 RepID=UPI0025A4148A
QGQEANASEQDDPNSIGMALERSNLDLNPFKQKGGLLGSNFNLKSFVEGVDKVATGLDGIGVGFEIEGDVHSAYLFGQGYRSGVASNYQLVGRNLKLFGGQSMTALSKPASWLTGFGSGISYGATFLSMGVLTYEGVQVWNGRADRTRFGYHMGTFGLSAGLAFYMVGQLVLQ